ncbi:hypothetical protein Gogos_003988, partial [Gossypium gossypioides]|nr:hypothetical protein [Gossypium gossypioides]
GLFVDKKENGFLVITIIWGVNVRLLRLNFGVFLKWNFTHIPRESNRLADSLTKMTSGSNSQVQLFVRILEEFLDEFGFDRVVEFS